MTASENSAASGRPSPVHQQQPNPHLKQTAPLSQVPGPDPAPAPGIVVRFVLGVGWVAAGAPAMGGLMQRSSQKQSLFNYGTGGGAKRVSIKHLRGSIAVPQGSQCGK